MPRNTRIRGDAVTPLIGITKVGADFGGGSPGTLAFNSATYSVAEDGTPVTAVTVTRTGGSSGAVSVTCTPSNGTATSPGDYDSSPITVNFADGDTSETVTVPIVNDTASESDETINLTLSGATGGASIGAQSTAVLTITANDSASPGTLQFSSATYAVSEDGTPVSAITVNRSVGTSGAVGCTCTPSNGTATTADYTNTPISVSFADGESSKTVTVPITDDALFDAGETVTLTLSAATGGATIGAQSTATLTINDNEGGGNENRLLYSEQMENAVWTLNNGTMGTTNAATAPDGATTAELFIPNTGTNTKRTSQSYSVTSGQDYCYSVYAKAGGYNFLQLYAFATTFGSTGHVNFNLSTGAIAQDTSGIGTITDVGNGWYRCTITRPGTASGSGYFANGVVSIGTAGRLGTMTGDGTSGIYFWGAQVVHGTTPKNYVRTTNLTVIP